MNYFYILGGALGMLALVLKALAGSEPATVAILLLSVFSAYQALSKEEVKQKATEQTESSKEVQQ